MKATRTMIVVESKLLSRDWALLSYGLVFPAVLLLLLGFIPGVRDVEPLFDMRPIDRYTAIVLVITFAMTGATSIPSFLATYRHEGVLRRLRTTPVGPVRLLGAQLVAHLLLASAATVLSVGVALLVLDVPSARSWLGLLVSLLLAATALFSIGLLVGALAPNPSSAPTIGTFVWLVLLFLTGIMYPREAMADGLRTVSDLSPSGAAVDAVQGAWFGAGPPLSSLAALAVCTVVVGLLAAWTFRWE